MIERLTYFLYFSTVKKAAIFLFSFFYLLLSTGVLFSVHYCKGEPVAYAVSLSSEADSCGDGEESCVSPCCGNESVFLKIEKEHISTAVKHISFVTASEIKNVFHLTPINYTEVAKKSLFIPEAPPLIPEKIFLKNCSLITYG